MTSPAGLSCYTSALHGYLSAEWDADELLARSVQLAVRRPVGHEPLAFSHHAPPLDVLADGSHLSYQAGTADEALVGLARELDRYGRAIAVTDAARLPWSVGFGGASAPHWILLEGCSTRRYLVRDGFSALLPRGEQRPWQGEVTDAELIEAMTLPAAWQPAQVLRNRLVFGAPTVVPAGRLMWLRRLSGMAAVHTLPDGDGWHFGDAALDVLIDDFRADPGHFFASSEDLWAAAGHQGFALRWRHQHAASESSRDRLQQQIRLWDALPKTLRVAQESADRGRPRPTLVETALNALRAPVECCTDSTERTVAPC